MHDRNGTPIQKGDVVMVEALVAETYACEEYCNAQLKIGFEKDHGPDNVTATVTVNTKQVLLLKRTKSITSG